MVLAEIGRVMGFQEIVLELIQFAQDRVTGSAGIVQVTVLAETVQVTVFQEIVPELIPFAQD
jgi:hypothetical protein